MTTLFLRTEDNQTLVDIEIYHRNNIVTDLRSIVVIDSYSNMLLKNQDKAGMIVAMFDRLSELRGWLFEYHLPQIDSKPTPQKIIEFITGSFTQPQVGKLSLHWVTD